MQKQSFVTLPCSYGEAYDKLSILHIKKQHLRGVQVERVSDEINAIATHLPLSDDDVAFHFHTLKYINTEIWNSQETLRSSEKWGDTLLNKQIHQLNDQRFRIKRKLNKICGSEISEQKSYGQKTAYFFPGMKFTDSILGIGAARYLSTLYDMVWFFVSENYKSSVEAILQDDSSIIIQTANSKEEARNIVLCNRNSSNKDDQIYFCESKKDDDFKFGEFKLAIYDYFNFDRKIFWEFFHCSTSGSNLNQKNLSENVINKDRYIFVDSHLSDSPELLVQGIENRFNFSKDSVLVVDPQKNHYALGTKYYEIAQSLLGLPIEKYKKLIENAWILVLGPNELASFAINLKIKTDKCYVYDVDRDLSFLVLMYEEERAENKQIFLKM